MGKGKSVHVRTPAKQIKLAEDGTAPQKIQLLAPGVYNHPFYGIMRINAQTFSDMVTNAAANVRGQRLPMDYGHDTDGPASGWIQNVYAEADGLYADVEWTPAALQGIQEKEWAYISADFYFQWEDPASGMLYENVLNGAALTNRPFIKNMKAVANLSEGTEAVILSEITEKEIQEGIEMKTAEQFEGEITKLSESVKGHEAKVGELTAKLSESEKEIATLRGEKATMLKEKELNDKKAKFAELCRAGKAVAAQEEAFLEGDMLKFAELSVKANVTVDGNGGEPKVEEMKLSEAEKAYCKASGLSEEDFIKYNK